MTKEIINQARQLAIRITTNEILVDPWTTTTEERYWELFDTFDALTTGNIESVIESIELVLDDWSDADPDDEDVADIKEILDDVRTFQAVVS